MGKKRGNHFFTNDTNWQNTVQSRSIQNVKKQALNANAFLYPIDESEEFFDPFSELSLFLAKKISSVISAEKTQKQWSTKLQKLLLDKILPEFQKKFPKYRLGGSSLKKTYEKVSYYYQKMQKEADAFCEDGSLDLNYLIRENLKYSPASQTLHGVHPYNYSHQLAVKISECIAVLDGKKIPLDHLTKTIWSVQKHLLSQTDAIQKAPFEKHDLVDKLLIRHVLQIVQENPHINQESLSTFAFEKVKDYGKLQKLRQMESMKPIICMLLSDMVLKDLSIFRQLSSKKIDMIESFILKQIKRCKEQKSRLTRESKTSIVNRILALYPIAANLPRDNSKDQLDAAIQYVYSLSSNIFAPISPMMNQALLSFINSEIVSLKEKKEVGALEKVLSTLLTVFQDANELPRLNPKQMSELEAWIWHLLSKDDLPSLQADTKSIIKEEISHILVEKESFHFKEIVSETMQLFKKINETEYFKQFFQLTKDQKLLNKLESKSHLWSIQNDLICSILQFDEKASLIKETKKYLDELNAEQNVEKLIEKIAEQYIRHNTFLSSQSYFLKIHIAIILKNLWYKEKSNTKETSFQRFVKWHTMIFLQKQPNLSSSDLNESLRNYIEQALPLIPFDSVEIKNSKCS